MKSLTHSLFILILLVNLPAIGAVESNISVISDVEFATPYGTKLMDIYIPSDDTSVLWRPSMIWMHGAGEGDKEDELSVQVCTFLARNGIVAASINYGPKAPRTESILSCKSAVRFLRQSSPYYKLDTSRIGVGGSSLGGFLALMVSATQDTEAFQLDGTGTYPSFSDDVSLILNFYGFVDSEALQLMYDRIERNPSIVERLQKFSPSSYIGPKMAPTLTLHGTSDEFVPDSQSLLLNDLLNENKVSHELVLLDDVGHGFDLDQWNGKSHPLNVRARILQFLKHHYPLPRTLEN